MGPNCPIQRRGNGACNYQENGVATFGKNDLQLLGKIACKKNPLGEFKKC
jgi:hypothetical protein